MRSAFSEPRCFMEVLLTYIVKALVYQIHPYVESEKHATQYTVEKKKTELLKK